MVQFLCMLALSSVTSAHIFSHYPDCGEERDKLFFNCKVEPRKLLRSVHDVHILFCFQGYIQTGNFFKPNHYVPLLVGKCGNKRKFAPQINTSTILPKKVCVGNVPSFELPKNIKKGKVQSKLSFITSTCKSILPKPINSKQPNYFVLPHTTSMESATPVLSQASVLTPVPLLTDNVTSAISVSSPPSVRNKSSPSCSSDLKLPADYLKYNYDVASFRKKIVDSQKSYETYESLAKNVFKPDESFPFTKTNGRCFRMEWLKSFPWLCYSPSEDGAFCISCVLFGGNFSSKSSKLKKLYSEPFKHWPDAYPAFNRHQDSKRSGLHAFTYPQYLSLLGNVSGKSQPIDTMIDASLRKRVAQN